MKLKRMCFLPLALPRIGGSRTYAPMASEGRMVGANLGGQVKTYTEEQLERAEGLRELLAIAAEVLGSTVETK